jgi:hypothetical protein
VISLVSYFISWSGVQMEILALQKGAAGTTPGSDRVQPRPAYTLRTTFSGTAEPAVEKVTPHGSGIHADGPTRRAPSPESLMREESLL